MSVLIGDGVGLVGSRHVTQYVVDDDEVTDQDENELAVRSRFRLETFPNLSLNLQHADS